MNGLSDGGPVESSSVAAAEAARHSSAIDQLNRRCHDAGVEFKESDLSIPSS
jgi:hypothetical protein